MNKVFSWFIVLLLTSSTQTLAQRNYKQGFIINLENDTIVQQIAYGPDKKNYFSCRAKINGEKVEYSPLEIKGFGFKDDKFYSSQITKGLFVKRLIEDEMSLYRSKIDFYLRKNGKTYFLESNEDDLTTKRDKNYKWKGIFIYLTKDCEGFSEKLTRRIKLHEEEVTQLVQDYNNCDKMTE